MTYLCSYSEKLCQCLWGILCWLGSGDEAAVPSKMPDASHVRIAAPETQLLRSYTLWVCPFSASLYFTVHISWQGRTWEPRALAQTLPSCTLNLCFALTRWFCVGTFDIWSNVNTLSQHIPPSFNQGKFPIKALVFISKTLVQNIF